MLTKSDLNQIKTVVRSEISSVDSKLTKLDLKLTEFQTETRKNFRKLEKKMDYVDKTLDREILKDRSRIKRIENHLGLQTLAA